MANPLILTEEEWMPRQAEFAEYDQAYSEPCVPTADARAFMQKIRKELMGAIARAAQKAATPAQAPIWGPTVKSDSAITIYYKLVPQGTEDEHRSTDIAAPRLSPPPPPLSDPFNGTTFMVEPRPMNQEAGKGVPSCESPPLPTGKLYRVAGLVEVTPEDVNAEMIKRGRKNAKAAVYIRGAIVEPRLRVEI